MDTTKCFTPKQLAARWSVSERMVYDLLRDRSLVGFKIGSAWRITSKAVDDYENGYRHGKGYGRCN